MTEREMERELARATGETVSTIRSRGFSLVEVPDPQILDWDEVQQYERSRAPLRRRPTRQKLAA